MDNTTIEPLVCNRISTISGVTFSAACFAGDHWSLAKLYSPEDARANATLAEEVGTALRGLGATSGFAPTPTEANGEIIYSRDLAVSILLPYGVVLHRNKLRPADGTFLTKTGQAGIFSAAGCGMVVASCRKTLLFAHGGRESLLDRTEITTCGATRSRDRDLVDNIVNALLTREPSAHPRDIYAWPMYFIKPEHFIHPANHPEHGKYNRAAIEYLPKVYGEYCGRVRNASIEIDLPHIARAQFARRGVPKINVSLDHAYIEDELPTTRNGGGRYLVAVVRH